MYRTRISISRVFLDPDCGYCDLLRYLTDNYHQQFTGVDISSGSFPEQSYSKYGKEFRCIRHNASNLDFILDNSVDAVVSVWALHEMYHPKSILTEVQRMIRSGGDIQIVDFSNIYIAHKILDENYYQPEEIRHFLLKTGFTDIKVRLIEQKQVI